MKRSRSALLAEITALWQTDDVRSARPTVRDEVRMALDYYEASLFATVPVLYTEIAATLDAEFPSRRANAGKLAANRRSLWLMDRRRPRRQSVCDLGSTTAMSLAMSRELLLEHYLTRVARPFRRAGLFDAPGADLLAAAAYGWMSTSPSFAPAVIQRPPTASQ